MTKKCESCDEKVRGHSIRCISCCMKKEEVTKPALEIFTEDDFHKYYYADDKVCSAAQACEIANEKLNQYISEHGVKVYGSTDKRYWDDHEPRSEHQYPVNCEHEESFPKTHSAILINVQEIKKECEHEPNVFASKPPDECRYCGVKLKLTWEVAE